MGSCVSYECLYISVAYRTSDVMDGAPLPCAGRAVMPVTCLHLLATKLLLIVGGVATKPAVLWQKPPPIARKDAAVAETQRMIALFNLPPQPPSWHVKQ